MFLTNHNRCIQSKWTNQNSKHWNTCGQRQAQENMYTVFEQVKIGSESGARIFSQSQSIAMQHQSNCKITLGTQLKTALTDKDLYNKIIKYSMLTVYIF